jgi:hypothetical protein
MMMTEATQYRLAGDELYTFVAEFHTQHRIVQAELVVPYRRLSDTLNGSSEVVEIRPLRIEDSRSGAHVQMDSFLGQMAKEHVLFVLPIAEPERAPSEDNVAWKWMPSLPCFAGVGPYRIAGKVHIEGGRDPRTALRLLDHRFLAITDAGIAFPSGETRQYPTVLVNRRHLELVALGAAGQ